MKKIFYMWLSFWSVLMIWSVSAEFSGRGLSVSIKDTNVKDHLYQETLINKNNFIIYPWCIIHKKYELVKRPISPKNKNQRIFTRKNEKTSDLV